MIEISNPLYSNETPSSPLPPSLPLRSPKPDAPASHTPPPLPPRSFTYSDTTQNHVKTNSIEPALNNPAKLTKHHSLPSTVYLPDIYELPLSPTRQQLSEIALDHILPIRVAFCDSLYGICDSMTFLRDDIFDVHFMKETVMANVQTSDGSQFKIPLVTAGFQFAIMNSSQAFHMNNYTIEQLMKLAQLPKVVFVKQGSKKSKKSKSASELFVKGEVLILQSRNKSGIQCISLTCYDKKIIPKKSEIIVEINPSFLTFRFTDLIYFSTPLLVQIEPPSKVRNVFLLPCTIQHLNNEKSVIASYSNDPRKSHFEIYLDVPINFQTAGMLKQEEEALLEKSNLLYDNFSPSSTTTVISNSKHSRQNRIFELPAIRDDDWKKVVTLCKPKALVNKKASLDPKQHVKSAPEESEYTPLVPIPDHVSDLLSYTTPCQPLLPSRSQSFTHTTRNTKNECSPLLQLEDLSGDQVLDLLDKLNLSQYKEVFREEQITGDLLKEVDGEILEKDLKVTSKLHRLKLLRVINGKESLDSIFGRAS